MIVLPPLNYFPDMMGPFLSFSVLQRTAQPQCTGFTNHPHSTALNVLVSPDSCQSYMHMFGLKCLARKKTAVTFLLSLVDRFIYQSWKLLFPFQFQKGVYPSAQGSISSCDKNTPTRQSRTLKCVLVKKLKAGLLSRIMVGAECRDSSTHLANEQIRNTRRSVCCCSQRVFGVISGRAHTLGNFLWLGAVKSDVLSAFLHCFLLISQFRQMLHWAAQQKCRWVHIRFSPQPQMDLDDKVGSELHWSSLFPSSSTFSIPLNVCAKMNDDTRLWYPQKDSWEFPAPTYMDIITGKHETQLAFPEQCLLMEN